jgi:hypothetical protein
LPAEIREPWIKQKGTLLHPASNPRSESPSREVPKADKAKPKASAKDGEGPRAYGLSGVGKATVLAAAVAAISSLPGANAQPDDFIPSTSFELPHGLGLTVATFVVFFAMWVVFAMAITYRPKGVLSKCLRAFVCTGTFVLATLMLTDPRYSFEEVWDGAVRRDYAHWLLTGGTVTIVSLVCLWRRMTSYLIERCEYL